MLAKETGKTPLEILNLFVPDIAKTVEGRELAKGSGKTPSEILDMVT